ncbi:hypothetical protein [Paraglaciecola hydrolytica]|uniref:SnoaL-like domain-containing protein n=1 Tax=Paraglaciecola hydrolytica TaxID=1799789 RepID=A0A148KMK7_9ALTE|nr:hypothetical protein [Paraglaciecola hydrolytica]KXI27489.1 hypothetical protein AX660_22535 [Paraglaciecola hydrolytica]
MYKYIICFLVIVSIQVGAMERFSAQELLQYAQRYVEAKNKLQQINSAEQDINNYLALLSSDIKIETVFPDMEPVLTRKNELKDQMFRALGNEYDYSEMNIQESMVGLNSIILKVTEKSKHKGIVSFLDEHKYIRKIGPDRFIEGEITFVITLQLDQRGLIEFMSIRLG